jgi:hypothetical protein
MHKKCNALHTRQRGEKINKHFEQITFRDTGQPVLNSKSVGQRDAGNLENLLVSALVKKLLLLSKQSSSKHVESGPTISLLNSESNMALPSTVGSPKWPSSF